MKKHLILILVFALSCGMLACSDDNDKAGKPKPGPGADATLPDAGLDALDSDAADASPGDVEQPGDTEDPRDTTGDDTTGDDTTGDDTDPDASTPAANGLHVRDQVLAAAASNQVVVDSVTLAEPGFVVIYEQCTNCLLPGPGEVIGHQALTADTHADVAVTLERNARNNEVLYALLHEDSNANGTLDYPGPAGQDEPILQLDGTPITGEFTVHLPSLVVDDVRLTNLSTQVIIPEAYSQGPGWVVIRTGACSESGPVIGQAPLSDGAHVNIAVTLHKRPAMDGETLCATLHADTDELGEFEYWPADPDAAAKDAPVRLADDSLVQGDFQVALATGIPAIRITLSASGDQAFRITSVEPSYFYVGSLENDNPNLSLYLGWRYEIINTARAAHPLEFIGHNTAVEPTQDVVILSQAVQGSGEADLQTDWVEDGERVMFTPSGDPWHGGESNPYRIMEYRSANAPQVMRGSVGLLVF